MTFAKKAVCVVLTLLMLMNCMVINTFAVDRGSFTVKSSSSKVNPGDTVTVTVNLDEAMEAVGGLEFQLTYDETALEVANATKGNFLDVILNKDNADYVLFTATANDAGSGDNLPASAVLMTVEFTVKDGASGNIPVGMNIINYFSIDSTDYAYTVNPTTVTVCEHANTKQVDNGDGTHKIVCTDCDKIVTANQSHTYDTWTRCTDDNTKHQGRCACGNIVKEPHSGGTATCTQQAFCDKCHQPYGDFDENKHDMTGWGHDDGINGKHFQHCRNGCGKTVEEDCRGGTATCQAPAVCEVCDVNYGELGSHVYDENAWTPDANGTTHSHKCTVCQENNTLVQEHHVDSNNDKVCDKCSFDMSCHHTGGTATCTQKAVCTKCYEEYGEFAPHQFNVLQHDETQHWHKCADCDATDAKVAHNGTGDNAATCQHPATCDVCGQVYGDLADHNYNVLQSDSLKHWYKCASCSDTTGEVSHFGGEATCKDLAVCEICHQPYGIVDESKHTGGTANCVDKAKCSVCGGEYGEVNANNHKSPVTTGDKVATCTTPGQTGTGHCDACKQVIKQSEEIPALGHRYGAPTFTWAEDYSSCKATFTCTREGCTEQQENHAVTVNCNVTPETTESTCKDAGKTVYTATVSFAEYKDGEECKDTKTVDLPLAEHTYGNEIPEVPATCTENGTKAHFACSVCGKLFVLDGERYAAASAEDLVIPATGHDWGDWTVTKEATSTEEGSQTRVCKNDKSHTETKAIAKLPVDPVKPTDPTKPATGDTGVGVWVALLSVSALLGTAIVVKKRHA